MPIRHRRITTQWLRQVAATYGRTIGDIAYLFCSDEYILAVNRKYIDHDYYTDIITFDYSAESAPQSTVISGDIVISLETVASNAEKYKVPYEQELHRVMAHGILHLCGLKDKTPSERAEMQAAEDAALQLIKLA